MRSGSPPFDTSNTATNSESGNGGSHSRSQNKTTSGTKDKEANEGGSGGESGENGKYFISTIRQVKIVFFFKFQQFVAAKFTDLGTTDL